jgi:hypothetical protein
LFFGGTGVWTQGLTLAVQVLYNLSHSTSPHVQFPTDTLKSCSSMIIPNSIRRSQPKSHELFRNFPLLFCLKQNNQTKPSKILASCYQTKERTNDRVSHEMKSPCANCLPRELIFKILLLVW